MSNKRYDLTRGSATGAEVDFGYNPLANTRDEAMNARLLYVTRAQYGNDWKGIVHRHAFTEIFLILEGVGHFLIGGETVSVRKNDLVIINPMEEHAEFSTEAAPMAYTVLAVEGVRFSYQGDGQTAYPYLHISDVSRRLQGYAQQLLTEIRAAERGHESICQSLMSIILVLIREHQRVDISSAAVRNITSKCSAARAYLDNHFAEPVTLDELADAMHQSKFYLSHAFRNAFGVSPMRYLVERRLEEGKHLLRETNYSIGEISAMTGFSSASLFSQTFKRVMNMTPNEYRKRVERCIAQAE